MKITRNITFIIWVIFLSVCLITYISNPTLFSAENLTAFLKKFNNHILLVYIFLSLIRGFTLLPSTPLVIAGTLIFPDQPVLILIIAVICILISSALIYYFSEFLGFDLFFQKKYPEKMDLIRAKLNQPKGFLFIVLWAFFPLVPTDMVSYVAGTVRMNIAKFLTGIFLGELPICAFYVYAGRSTVNLIS